MDVFDLRMFVELRVISSIIGLPYDSILRFCISSQPHVKILLIFLFTGFTWSIVLIDFLVSSHWKRILYISIIPPWDHHLRNDHVARRFLRRRSAFGRAVSEVCMFNADLYWESTKSRRAAVNQGGIYRHIEVGRRQAGFHLDHMSTFDITADRVRLGRPANKVRQDESGYRWGRDGVYGFALVSPAGQLQTAKSLLTKTMLACAIFLQQLVLWFSSALFFPSLHTVLRHLTRGSPPPTNPPSSWGPHRPACFTCHSWFKGRGRYQASAEPDGDPLNLNYEQGDILNMQGSRPPAPGVRNAASLSALLLTN